MRAFRQLCHRSGAFLAGHRQRLANLGLVGGAGIVGALASLAALAFNTRTLSAQDFGTFMAIQAFIALCATISSAETWQTVCRLGTEPQADLRAICRRTGLLDALASFAAFLLALAGIALAGAVTGLDPEDAGLTLIFALALLAGLTGTPKGYFRLRNRFDILAGNLLLNAGLTLGAAALLWYWQATLPVFIWTYTAIAICCKLQLFAALLVALARDDAAGGDGPAPAMGRVLRMSFAVSVLFKLGASRKNAATLLVSTLAGAAEAGLFAAALKFAAPLAKLAEYLRQVVFADVIRAFRESALPARRIARLRMLVLAMSAALMLAGAAAAVLAVPIMHLALDPGYAAAAPVLALLVIAECAQVSGILLNPVFQARGRTNLLSALQTAALAVCLAAALALGERTDALSMAWILLATSAALFAAQFAIAFAPRGLLARASIP